MFRHVNHQAKWELHASFIQYTLEKPAKRQCTAKCSCSRSGRFLLFKTPEQQLLSNVGFTQGMSRPAPSPPTAPGRSHPSSSSRTHRSGALPRCHRVNTCSCGYRGSRLQQTGKLTSTRMTGQKYVCTHRKNIWANRMSCGKSVMPILTLDNCPFTSAACYWEGVDQPSRHTVWTIRVHTHGNKCSLWWRNSRC